MHRRPRASGSTWPSSGLTARQLRDAGRGESTAVLSNAPGVSGFDEAAASDIGQVPDDELVTTLRTPDDVIVVVAGAANAGVSTVVQTLGFPTKTIGTAVIRS